jgi:hypothetical protein
MTSNLENASVVWNFNMSIDANKLDDVRFEVFTAVTMKNAVFWDVAP